MVDRQLHTGVTSLTRTQALVIGFLGLAWLGLVVILLVEPSIYDRQLNLPPEQGTAGELVFLASLSCLIALVIVGVLRRWRWMFWLLLVANLAGVLRAGASALQLIGVLPTNGPTWYVVFQAAIGVVQFAIGLLMLADYRRAGIWGASEHGA
jgi:hypothetical protein